MVGVSVCVAVVGQLLSRLALHFILNLAISLCTLYTCYRTQTVSETGKCEFHCGNASRWLWQSYGDRKCVWATVAILLRLQRKHDNNHKSKQIIVSHLKWNWMHFSSFTSPRRMHWPNWNFFLAIKFFVSLSLSLVRECHLIAFFSLLWRWHAIRFRSAIQPSQHMPARFAQRNDFSPKNRHRMWNDRNGIPNIDRTTSLKIIWFFPLLCRAFPHQSNSDCGSAFALTFQNETTKIDRRAQTSKRIVRISNILRAFFHSLRLPLSLACLLPIKLRFWMRTTHTFRCGQTEKTNTISKMHANKYTSTIKFNVNVESFGRRRLFF